MKILFSTPVRYVLLAVIAVVGFVLGYLRWTYALIWDNGFHFIYRHTLYKKNPYPNDLTGLIRTITLDPRLLSLIFYSVAPFLLSIATIYLAFLRKEFVIKTIWVYVVAWSLVLLISLLSIIFSNYSIGIGLAQNLKNLLQMPFFTLLLVAGFKVSQLMNDGSNN